MELLLHHLIPNVISYYLPSSIAQLSTLLHIQMLVLHPQIIEHYHLHVSAVMPPLLHRLLLLNCYHLLLLIVLFLKADQVLHTLVYLVDCFLVLIHLAQNSCLVQVGCYDVVLVTHRLVLDQSLFDFQSETD